VESEQTTLHATLNLLSSLIRELQETSVLESETVATIFDNAIKECLVQENVDGANLLRKMRR